MKTLREWKQSLTAEQAEAIDELILMEDHEFFNLAVQVLTHTVAGKDIIDLIKNVYGLDLSV